jgi:hypothetical protein
MSASTAALQTSVTQTGHQPAGVYKVRVGHGKESVNGGLPVQ